MPNRDDIGYTRFEGGAGGARLGITLDELPKRLHLPVTPLVRKLVSDQTSQLALDWPEKTLMQSTVPDPNVPSTPETMLTCARPWLQHIAWWIEYSRRLRVCQGRAAMAKKDTAIKWHCVDCETELSIKRETCNNNRCPSHDTLATITGLTRAARAAKSA